MVEGVTIVQGDYRAGVFESVALDLPSLFFCCNSVVIVSRGCFVVMVICLVFDGIYDARGEENVIGKHV